MKRRMTMATAAAGLALALLTACGTSEDAPDVTSPTSEATSAPTATPSVDASSKGAIALRGDWEIPKEDYILHLKEDGTFVEDYQGIVDFRVGKYSVDDDVISLIGDEGDTDKGKVVDDTLVLGLGTATRM